MPARFRTGSKRYHAKTTTYSSSAGGRLHATTTTSSGYTPGSSFQAPSPPSVSLPSPSGKGGLVALLAALLFVFATWSQLGSKIWAVIWGSDTSPTTVYNVNWRLVFAGILFIVAMATLASINEDMGNIMALSVIAMWLVFIIQPGTPANQKSPISSFFDWFTKGAPQQNPNMPPSTGPNVIPGYPNNQYGYPTPPAQKTTPTSTVSL